MMEGSDDEEVLVEESVESDLEDGNDDGGSSVPLDDQEFCEPIADDG